MSPTFGSVAHPRFSGIRGIPPKGDGRRESLERGTAGRSGSRRGARCSGGAARQPVFNLGTLAPGPADREGVSVFAKDDAGAVYRTYSTYGRGIDLPNTAYNYLDLVPLGRGEEGRAPP